MFLCVRVVRLARQILLLLHQPLRVTVDLCSLAATVAIVAIIITITTVQ